MISKMVDEKLSNKNEKQRQHGMNTGSDPNGNSYGVPKIMRFSLHKSRFRTVGGSIHKSEFLLLINF